MASSSEAAPINTQLPEMLVSGSTDWGALVAAAEVEVEVGLVPAAVVVGSLENVGPARLKKRGI